MNDNLYKLLLDFSQYDYSLICEQKNSDAAKTYRIKGPYIVVGEKNANGRSYSPEVMEEAVKNYQKDKIENKLSVGELSHPASAQINLENACHLVESLVKDGNMYIGTSRILQGHPKGDLLLALAINGVKTGTSTRGVGHMNNQNLVDDYKLIAVDIVSDPSTNKYVDTILESKNYMIDTHGNICEVAYERFEKKIETLPNNTADRRKMITEALRSFLKQI